MAEGPRLAGVHLLQFTHLTGCLLSARLGLSSPQVHLLVSFCSLCFVPTCLGVCTMIDGAVCLLTTKGVCSNAQVHRQLTAL